MSRWSRDATEFTVSVMPQPKSRSHITSMPRPILGMSGHPHRTTFKIRDGGQVTVERADE